MLYVEDINSKALMQLNSQMIQLKKSKEYCLGKKLYLMLSLCKTKRIKELWGLILLSIKKTNKIVANNDDYVNKEYVQNYAGKVVVYSCIFGSNEEIENPLFVSKNCDYFIFTDKEVSPSSVWKKYDCSKIQFPCKKPNEMNRYIKLHPHLFFPQYEYSLYIDGNITLVTDVLPLVNQMSEEEIISIHKHDRRSCAFQEAETFWHIPRLKPFAIQAKNQLLEYEKEGFPKNFGLYENPIILRRHNNETCICMMNLWWKQLETFSMRDQISLPYVVWKLGISEKEMHIMGNNLRDNPRFIQREH